jgi:mRNA interferase MazF
VYWTRFDPALGSEIGKTRPALVIQNDTGNRFAATTIVAAISSRYAESRFPFLVPLPAGVLPRDCAVNCAQLRTVDRSRLSATPVAMLDATTMRDVDIALMVSLGLDASRPMGDE